jgi:RNA polymerase primary sigma factor
MADEIEDFEPDDESVPESEPDKEPPKESVGPVTADSLSSYLKEIRDIPVLSREEEQILARKMIKGSKEAMDMLIRSNLKYVVSVANKYKGCGLSLLDLINEGNIGLIQAAKRFDPDKGVKFITYGVWWIRQSIMHALAEQSGTVRLPIKQAGKLYKIGEKYQELKKRTAGNPRPMNWPKSSIKPKRKSTPSSASTAAIYHWTLRSATVRTRATWTCWSPRTCPLSRKTLSAPR